MAKKGSKAGKTSFGSMHIHSRSSSKESHRTHGDGHLKGEHRPSIPKGHTTGIPEGTKEML